MRRRGFIPVFVAFATVVKKLLIVAEIMNEAFFGGFVKLAPVIVIFATDCRAVGIYGTAAVNLNMLTATFYEQIPAAVIFVNFDVLVGNLPQQMAEILFGARCIKRLGSISAADSTGTATAFVVDGYCRGVAQCQDSLPLLPGLPEGLRPGLRRLRFGSEWPLCEDLCWPPGGRRVFSLRTRLFGSTSASRALLTVCISIFWLMNASMSGSENA